MSFLSLLLLAGVWISEPAFPSGSSLEGSILTYQPQDKFSGTKVSFIKTDSGNRLMIHLLWAPLEEQDEIPIKILFSDQTKKTIQGHLLKGGHKIVLTTEASDEISSNLLKGEKILLKIGPYQAELTSDQFPEGWRNFKKDP